MLNYKQLYYFWHVARCGSVTQAAEQLHLTPQTISGQVAELEQSLGVALFNRVGRRLVLTARVGRRRSRRGRFSRSAPSWSTPCATPVRS